MRWSEGVKGDEDVSEFRVWDVLDVVRPEGEACLGLRRFGFRVWVRDVVASGPPL